MESYGVQCYMTPGDVIFRAVFDGGLNPPPTSIAKTSTPLMKFDKYSPGDIPALTAAEAGVRFCDHGGCKAELICVTDYTPAGRYVCIGLLHLWYSWGPPKR